MRSSDLALALIQRHQLTRAVMQLSDSVQKVTAEDFRDRDAHLADTDLMSLQSSSKINHSCPPLLVFTLLSSHHL